MEHQSQQSKQQNPLPVANEKGNPAFSAKGSRNKSFGALREKGSEEMILLEFSQDLTLVADAHELEALIVKTLRAMESFQGFSISKILPGRAQSQTYMENFNLGPAPQETECLEVTGIKFPMDDGLQNRVLESYVPLRFHIGNEVNRGTKSGYLDRWKRKGIVYMIGIALRHADQDLGILWLSSEDLNFYLIKNLAALISTALTILWAGKELENKKVQRKLLLDFSKGIAGIKEIVDLEKGTIKMFHELFGARLALIHGLGHNGAVPNPVIFDQSLPGCSTSEGKSVPLFEPLDMVSHINRILESPNPLSFNLDFLSGSIPMDRFQKIKALGFNSCHGVRLVVGKRPLGVLWVLADNIDADLLLGVCSQISMALSKLLETSAPMGPEPQCGPLLGPPDGAGKREENHIKIIGKSEPMLRVQRLIAIVAPTNSTVLVTGETGTGKELIAKAIHRSSSRSNGPMVKVNCAAIPSNLIESELFGHEKGAFTGALEKRIGKFELADNGTLFLDEIGEMPLGAQAKLLRVLQEREVERIGGQKVIKVNVRVIAATNRDLEKEINLNRFRLDLFYRLNVFPIHVPPLRERLEDIGALSDFFLSNYSRLRNGQMVQLGPKALQQLYVHTWPGNVRELEHLIERNVLLATRGIIQKIEIGKVTGHNCNFQGNLTDMTLEELERSFILQTLKRCRGKISGPGGAAEILGIPGNTLHSKMKKFSITRFDYSKEEYRFQRATT